VTESRKEIALEQRENHEARLFSPSAARNRDPIREAFLKYMPDTGVIVEVGSGTGEHVVHIARALPGVHFRPGDPDAASRESIAAWTVRLGLKNIDPPHAADVASAGWSDDFHSCDGLLSINMLHIAPFDAARGLFTGARSLLHAGGRLFLYGPFSRHGVHTAPSNEAFDASLKLRNPLWGVRDLEGDILPLAEAALLRLVAIETMPANNLCVVFEKT